MQNTKKEQTWLVLLLPYSALHDLSIAHSSNTSLFNLEQYVLFARQSPLPLVWQASIFRLHPCGSWFAPWYRSSSYTLSIFGRIGCQLSSDAVHRCHCYLDVPSAAIFSSNEFFWMSVVSLPFTTKLFTSFIFYSRANGPVSTKFDLKHPWVKEI